MVDKTSSKTVQFVLLSLVFLGVSLAVTIFPLLILPLQESLGVSYSLAGLLYTVMLTASGLGRFLESFGADQLGREPFLLLSGFIAVVGTLGFMFARQYWLLSISVFFMGIGNGLFVPAGFAAISDLYPRQKGKYIGIYDSLFPLSALGAYGVATVGAFLGSWRYAIGLIGIYLLVVSITLYIVYRPVTIKDKANKGEEFLPVEQIKSAYRKAKSSPIFLKMVMLVIPVVIFARGMINFFPAFLVQVKNVPEAIANLLYMIFMALIIPGKTLSGKALDKKGARWVFFFDISLVLVGFAIFSQVPGLWVVPIGVILVAPSRGGIFTLMHAHLLDTLPKESVNLLYGLFMVCVSIFGSIGPGFAGYLIDYFGFRAGFFGLILVLSATLPIIYSLEKR